METIDFTPQEIASLMLKVIDAEVISISISSNLLRRLVRGLHRQKGNPFDNYFDNVKDSQRDKTKDHQGYMWGKPVFVDRDLVNNTLVLTTAQKQMRYIIREEIPTD